MTAPRLALAALIMFKLILLVAIGPLASPDTRGYAAIATAMQSGAYWGALDLHDPNAAFLTARALGYPVLMAGADTIAGPGAFWLIALVQIAVGVAAAVALYVFARDLLQSCAAALLVAAAYATGLPLVFDQTVLTDGLYASLLVLFLALLGRWTLRRAPVGYRALLWLGLLPAAAMLLRETTTQILAMMLPVIACFLYATRAGIRSRGVALGAVILPFVAMTLAVVAFNATRTGAFFITSGLRSAALVPLVQLQARGVSVFDGDDPLARALREEIKEWRNEAIYAAVPRVEQRLGITPVAMSDAVRRLVLRTVLTHPVAYARLALSELRPRYLAFSVAPAASLGTLIASRGGELLSVAQSIPGARLGRIAVFGLYGAMALAGGLCWLAMAIGLPLLAVARLRAGHGVGLDLALLLALAAFHLGLLALYALVHIEARYLMAAQIVPPLAAAFLVLAWTRRRPG